MKFDEIQWGGSGIERQTFEYMKMHIKKGSNVIEIGAGNCSTVALSSIYNLYSIENEKDWCGLHEGVNYIHAPIKGDWYDVLKIKIPMNHKLVFIDGPTGVLQLRAGILNHLDMFNPKAMFIIHDTYRQEDKDLTQAIAKKLDRGFRFIDTEDDDHFGVILGE